jgi:hypothetical protein
MIESIPLQITVVDAHAVADSEDGAAGSYAGRFVAIDIALTIRPSPAGVCTRAHIPSLKMS